MTVGPDVTPKDVARKLAEALQRTYGDDDVTTQIFNSTVTIARGKSAVQIFVTSNFYFQVSTRRRDAFHMMPGYCQQNELVEIIKKVIGPAKARAPLPASAEVVATSPG